MAAGPSDPIAEMNHRLSELTAGLSGNAERVATLEHTLGQLGSILQQVQSSQQLLLARVDNPTPALASGFAPATAEHTEVKPRLPSALKVQQASKYGGEREEDVEAFLFKLEELFDLTKTEDHEHRVKFAGQLLESKAATWYRAKRAATAMNRISTWDDFKTGLRAQFQPVDKVNEAKEELLRLDQSKCGRGTVRDYTERFLHLATIVPDMRDKDLLCIFLAGLKGKTRVEMKLRNPQSLADALEMTEKFETALHQSGWRFLKSGVPGTSSGTSQQSGDPMDLSAIGQPGQVDPENKKSKSRVLLTKEEEEHRRAAGLCFKCGQAGHRARNCPKPNAGNGQLPAQRGR